MRKPPRYLPTPPVWNDIAFDLADSKFELDKAQQYAESAVPQPQRPFGNVDLPHVTPGQIARSHEPRGLLGHSRLGLFPERRSCKSRNDIFAQHGCSIRTAKSAIISRRFYEKRGEKDRAIQAYALALAAPQSVPETRARLTLLLGGNSRLTIWWQGRAELAALRTIAAGKLLDEDAKADFFIAFLAGEKTARVEAVRFISGSEKLRPLADRLRSLDYGAVFPDASPMKIVRRGTLSCSAKDGDCALTLSPRKMHADKLTLQPCVGLSRSKFPRSSIDRGGRRLAACPCDLLK